MTLEERVLVAMYTRAVNAMELIQNCLRLSTFLKEDKGFSPESILHLLARADDRLQALTSVLSMKVSEHTENKEGVKNENE